MAAPKARLAMIKSTPPNHHKLPVTKNMSTVANAPIVAKICIMRLRWHPGWAEKGLEARQKMKCSRVGRNQAQRESPGSVQAYRDKLLLLSLRAMQCKVLEIRFPLSC